ncbi:iron-sulfur cluster assembly accessory protein [Paracoccus mutanolyticus]|uniref:Iron-sulfur cluster assembly accessory protein n=1 Tax=Paracoccus mutanolyticus TaxID=1499308 RepID=A0ABM6WV57_9RHOB|nr:iron-sulfur cluster assembly accessory protein [Paracoccus mutanolyticus]AWX94492.1 iron-sulfur cluster assembly accessory protein [Paracoccus mutanolyticus]
MFSIPGKSPVSITPAAERQIARLMAAQSASGLRIGLKKGGCAGMEYTMEAGPDPRPRRRGGRHGAARVLIAPTAQMFLFGTEIDYESGLLESGFKFRNPNVTDSCGCGESVSFGPLEGSRART